MQASDARHFSPNSFAEYGPELEESDEEEDKDKDDLDKFGRHTGNMDEHAEVENCLYIGPLSPPPARARITEGDRHSDPWSTADLWSTGVRDTSAFAEKFRGPEKLSTPIADFADRHRPATAPVSASEVTKAFFFVTREPEEVDGD